MNRKHDLLGINLSQRQITIRTIDRKWQDPELNKKLEAGDVQTGIQWELDYQYKRELRAGLHDRGW